MTIIKALPSTLWTDHAVEGILNQHTIDLIIIGFFWLLRPSEYCWTNTPEARTQAFLFRHTHITIGQTTYTGPTAPLNDQNDVLRITAASLEFYDQKNAVRGEQVGQQANSDPFFCPAKALGRIVLRLRKHKADPTTPIHHHFNTHPSKRNWYPVKVQFITNALRHAAQTVSEQTGIDPKLISARSLRPGGATALLCAKVDTSIIQLIGRWKSDAMFRYLRIQAACHANNYAQQMLDHGAYTFSPQSFRDGDLPNEVPADFHQVLNHPELYED